MFASSAYMQVSRYLRTVPPTTRHRCRPWCAQRWEWQTLRQQSFYWPERTADHKTATRREGHTSGHASVLDASPATSTSAETSEDKKIEEGKEETTALNLETAVFDLTHQPLEMQGFFLFPKHQQNNPIKHSCWRTTSFNVMRIIFLVVAKCCCALPPLVTGNELSTVSVY